MTDVLTKKQRSYCMSRIRASKTKPELKLRKIMKIMGFSYQPKIYGRPDFANKGEKIAVFIDGCFWHKCPIHYKSPKQNKTFWKRKIDLNVKRDIKTNKNLKKAGWKVIRIPEHNIKSL